MIQKFHFNYQMIEIKFNEKVLMENIKIGVKKVNKIQIDL